MSSSLTREELTGDFLHIIEIIFSFHTKNRTMRVAGGFKNNG